MTPAALDQFTFTCILLLSASLYAIGYAARCATLLWRTASNNVLLYNGFVYGGIMAGSAGVIAFAGLMDNRFFVDDYLPANMIGPTLWTGALFSAGLFGRAYLRYRRGHDPLEQRVRLCEALEQAESAARTAEAERQSVEQMFRSILDNMPGVVAIVDERGTYQVVSRTFADFFGWQPVDMVGKTFADLFPADDAARYLSHVEVTLRTGTPQPLLEQSAAQLDTQGVARTWAANFFPVRGHPTLCGLIAIDVTQLPAEQQRLLASLASATRPKPGSGGKQGRARH